MSCLNYMKLDTTFSNIYNTTQPDDATKCHYAFKNFWGEPWCVSYVNIDQWSNMNEKWTSQGTNWEPFKKSI